MRANECIVQSDHGIKSGGGVGADVYERTRVRPLRTQQTHRAQLLTGLLVQFTL
jgi:hypothetical protein